MALLVWLPLNSENLVNNGIAPLTWTVTGTHSLADDGVLGRSWLFDGGYITSDTAAFSEGMVECTISCWIKNMGATGTWYRIGGFCSHRRTHLDIHSTNNGVRLFASTTDASDDTAGAVQSTINTTDQQWHFICGVVTATKNILYIDGVKVGETAHGAYTKTVARPVGVATISSGTAFHGYMQDFRIYDEALSAKQVEELYKGLVLHFPLDNNGFGPKGNANLLVRSRLVIGGASGEGSSHVRTYESYGTKIESHSSSWISLSFPASSTSSVTTNLADGDTYTASFEIKNETLTGKPLFYINNDNGYKSCSLGTMEKGKWCLIGYTTTWVGSTAAVNLHLNNATGTFWVRNFKIEKGSAMTPWIPHTSDPEYGSWGTNSGNYYDISGYGYIATGASTLTTYIPSPRYTCASHFANAISIPGTTTANIRHVCNNNSFTLTFWMHRASSVGATTVSGILNFGTSGTNKLLHVINRGSSSRKLAFAFYSNDYESPFDIGEHLDEWNHIAMVCDNLTRYVYVNGELLGSYTGTTQLAVPENSNFNLGIYSSLCREELSDFRLYAQPLTAAQILELYLVSMNIDSNGNILPRVLTS